MKYPYGTNNTYREDEPVIHRVYNALESNFHFELNKKGFTRDICAMIGVVRETLHSGVSQFEPEQRVVRRRK